jgi:phosphatidyl-myo-inositol dimannoside synthase
MTSLLISDIFPPQTGGSGRWFWEVYRRLPRDQFVIAAGEHLDQDEFDRRHNLRLIRLPLTFNSWGLLDWRALWDHGLLLRKLRSIVHRYDIKNIHCGCCLPVGLQALALNLLYRIPFLCFVHGEELSVGRQSRELLWWMRQIFRRANVLIANSHSTATLLQRDWQVPPARIRVLHPGVDTARFVPAARNALVRAQLGWGDRPVILTVGRMQKRKGHDQMILALHRIKVAFPDILYSIVGDGEERRFLHDLTTREGLTPHVQFVGEINDARMLAHYQQCDLFALPNRQVGGDFEGFGMVLLEAQACGRPVLAGDSGGTRETMCIPQTGQIVPCESSPQLAATVIDLLSDHSRLDRMGAAGRQWVVERFDWSSLSRQAQELFRGSTSFAGDSQSQSSCVSAARIC